MPKFSKENQPKGRGRPQGSKNKRGQFSDALTEQALKNLEQLVNAGDIQASLEVLKRTHPVLKAITPENSLDGELMKLKMREISEFEERLKALEDSIK